MSNLWDENQNEEFRDIPDEVNNAEAPPSTAVSKQSQKPSSGQIPFNALTGRFEEAPVSNGHSIGPQRPPSDEEPESIFDPRMFGETEEEEDFTESLSDANLRIEQGRLYQMIMNHDLFDNVDVDPRAVKIVQREIRKIAHERMEIMLGMRKETATVERLDIDFPFNAMEVQVLKSLAFTATKGASQDSDRFVPEVRRITEEVNSVPKRTSLNTISSKKVPAKVQNLPAKPKAPIKRQRPNVAVEQILAEEGVSLEELELEYKGIGKPLHKLTDQELSERQRETARRLATKKTVKSSSALPMATPEQQAMLALQRAEQIGTAPGMQALLDKVKAMPIKSP